ncbi:MAG TPA: hypothetical protein VMV04_02620, partial [Thermodesulfobacteriota bacterium]|nr:hypothetical protein [Thermodesulfobacteriota bacterium]
NSVSCKRGTPGQREKKEDQEDGTTPFHFTLPSLPFYTEVSGDVNKRVSGLSSYLLSSTGGDFLPHRYFPVLRLLRAEVFA